VYEIPTDNISHYVFTIFIHHCSTRKVHKKVQTAKTDYVQKPKVMTDKICTISLVALNMYKLLQ
jgi:hypothetical protein